MERIQSQTSPQAAHGTKSQEQFVTVASPALPMQNWQERRELIVGTGGEDIYH